ncbi:aminoacyl-tRNA hydrolase [Mobiluncus mulieris]|uniref:Peptidyl-tRNA hydrolase n=1 Tax=Mobiluncus mulieris TaxID=2052 RepID=A0ABD4TYR0_9ACTO|nr:aminoacyl-tRNA hydrolase [Mobiluncus mulieris]MCU9969505.1 aminoacyl-tRNA hydrolase [Mobiluncus mulieris]MCU9973944.1 aminoacyl-tRNA hydrolase [Mobiluncus mulieris]MCV0009995.1 aminoacyl-tRNA hydrolase [Mobiluncus mulieris]NMW75756.1 aminoacyl-tRNA hydrolase [Mobiluncus mulieris]NMX01863.1 aminoacyl-tRNA hydrolase [Mobiluncus mulieris]
MEDGKGAWLVVGLGNPGIEYAQTRHNCGYMVTDRFVESVGGKYRNQSLGRGGAMAKVADIRLGYGIDAPQVIVAHTGTYMNTSGPVVGQLLKFYQIDTTHLVVVHDDIDLNFRCAKLKVGGSNGGHNGLKSIQQTLGTKDFARLRIGVGRPPSRELGGDVVNWVLGRFPKSEKANLEEFFDRAVQCINDVAESGLAKAQARLHLGNP